MLEKAYFAASAHLTSAGGWMNVRKAPRRMRIHLRPADEVMPMLFWPASRRMGEHVQLVSGGRVDSSKETIDDDVRILLGACGTKFSKLVQLDPTCEQRQARNWCMRRDVWGRRTIAGASVPRTRPAV